MSWLDTHKDAKKIETIEDLKGYLNKVIYYKEEGTMVVIERIRDNNKLMYHNVCDLWYMDAAEFDKCSFYIPYKNDEEIKKEKIEEELKTNFNAKGVTKVVTEYFGTTYEVPKEGLI